MRWRTRWVAFGTVVALSGCGAASTASAPASQDTAAVGVDSTGSTDVADRAEPSDAEAGDAEPSDAGAVALTPARPRMARLTARQYRSAVRDLFGPDIVPPSALEPDQSQDALIAIGSRISSVSPRGVEQYFDAAQSLADQVLASPTARAAMLPCAPSGADDLACAKKAIAFAGRRIWRRPLTTEEVDGVAAQFQAASTALGTFDQGLRYALVTLLASPSFLYRIELGAPDDATGVRRYTGFELAARLSFFLWNSTPDDALLDAAESGALDTDDEIVAQVDRLLADDRAHDGVRTFFGEWLDLYALDQLGKDPNIFKHFSADLGAAAREETLRLVDEWVFDRDGDYRELYTTRATWVDRRLAAIYDIPAPSSDGFAKVELPVSGLRRGLLGHVSFLAHQAHPTSSSATLRGKFVLQRLLCAYVAPPPTNLNTAIPEPSPEAKTLKQRLLAHMGEPSCAGCHASMDPIGFGLENFDGIGRFRTHDNGEPIDPSGTINGYTFKDGLELAEVVANAPELSQCVVKMVYSYAGGHLPEAGEEAQVSAITSEFVTGGHRIRALFRAVATSPGFRLVGDADDMGADETVEGAP